MNIYKKLIIILAIIAAPVTGAFADGLIVIPEPLPTLRTPFPLEVKTHKVDVSIDGLYAETSIDQEFFNPTQYRLEGYYIFPIPKNAVIQKFTMEIDGKETEAEMLDASKAREIYEGIVRKQLDPALMEYSDRGIFKLRIFPIDPKSTKRIKIRYRETLDRESGTVTYLYPLGTEKFSAKKIANVSVTVRIKSDQTLGAVSCPTHETTVTREGPKNATIRYEEHDARPDTDIKILYSIGDSKLGLLFQTYRDGSDDGFFFLNASPTFDIHPDISDKEIVFVLDTSGSMAGEKLDSAKRALNYCIHHLNAGDQFQIIRFSTEADSLFDKVTIADRSGIDRAERFIGSFKPIGGTNIEDAMKRAIDSFTKNDKPKMIVFITDGKPTLGETDDEKLMVNIKKQNPNNVKIFTFGVGYDINTHLLDRITEMTRAYRNYITPKEDIEKAVSQFYTKIQSPVLTDITVKITGAKATKVYPKDIPDLYAGSSISLFGRYDNEGAGVVTVEGKLKGKTQRYSYPVKFLKDATASDFIPPLWASRRVGYLLDQMRLYGESKEVVDEIVQLARNYGIITPYTSYLILEDEARKSERHEVSEDRLTLRNALPSAPEQAKEYKKDVAAMKSKSGAGSVDASRSLQSLADSDNIAQSRREQSRTTYSANGQQMQISQKTRMVQGNAFYQTGNTWTDSRIQMKKNAKNVQIRFASKEYFALAAKVPAASQFMAVGKLVKFIVDDTIYEIIE